MKRDFELVRKLLFYSENKENSSVIDVGSITIDGYKTDEINHHVIIMCEAGLLSYEGERRRGRLISAIPSGLKWEGYNFLDVARNEGLWNQVLRKAKESGIAVTLEVLSKMLKDAAVGAVS